jgi:hypothetical protein
MTATVLLVSAFAMSAQQNPIPEKYTNLKVLRSDIPRAELVPIMRSFAMGLGVRCEHCHVGEPGADLSTFDFASDERAPKAVARQMMRMLQRIESEDLKGLGDAARTPKVTCFTCHRGARTPATTAGK